VFEKKGYGGKLKKGEASSAPKTPSRSTRLPSQAGEWAFNYATLKDSRPESESNPRGDWFSKATGKWSKPVVPDKRGATKKVGEG